MEKRYLTILGSTGSVGQASLEAYTSLNATASGGPFRLFALIARENSELLWQQILQYQPCYAILTKSERAEDLQARLKGYRDEKPDTQVLAGLESAVWACQTEAVSIVIAAASGHDTFPAMLAAIKSGKKILLANKESLIFGGEWLQQIFAQSTASIVPIDSEHNAIFQCLSSDLQVKVGRGVDLCKFGVEKVGLLATGGPFWGYSTEQLKRVTPEKACQHPVWRMGKKISVDCATLMNKALEYMEMVYLFGLPERAIEVQLHREAGIHGWVQYCDGHRLLHSSSPDMSLGVAYGISYPLRSASRPVGAVQKASWQDADNKMCLEPLCKEKVLALRLASYALKAGFWSPIVLNAANAWAVEAFLQKKIGFLSILELCERALDEFGRFNYPCDSLETKTKLDALTRRYCVKQLNLGKLA